MSSNKHGFLEIWVGGVGNRGGAEVDRHHRTDGRPYPRQTISLDTDPETHTSPGSGAHHDVTIDLDERKLAVLTASPERFGPNVRAITEQLAADLDPDELEHGSRTKRAITQLAVAFHLETIMVTLRAALDQLRRQPGVKNVIPLIISSSGGGAGSALQVLLAFYLANPLFRDRLLLGIDRSILKRTIQVIVEPYSYARTNAGKQERKILANAYAFRKESDWLLEQKAVQWAFHIGFSNNYGAVLADPRTMSRVLGNCVYEVQRNWGMLKGRIVDREFGKGYAGGDTPETVLRQRGHNFEER
jgi:hypothetical protein